MDRKDETREMSQWLILSIEMWLIVALGLAVGVSGLYLYYRVIDLENRIEVLEQGRSSSRGSTEAGALPQRARTA